MDKNKYTQEDIDKICKFIKEEKPDIYNLGAFICNSFVNAFTDGNKFHYRCDQAYMAHGVIYNRAYMKDFVQASSKGDIKHCDHFWNNDKYTHYTYHTPIVYQTFPNTENRRNWGGKTLDKKLNKYVTLKFIEALNLDKSHENFKTYRNGLRFGPAILLIILVIILVILLWCLLWSGRKRTLVK